MRGFRTYFYHRKLLTAIGLLLFSYLSVIVKFLQHMTCGLQIFHMFHRKVHPESSTIIQKTDKHQKFQRKKKPNHNHDGCYNNGEQTSDEDIMIYPQRTLSKPSFRRIKNQFPPHELHSSDPNDNKERWINSDEDCKLLNSIFPSFQHSPRYPISFHKH